MAQPQKKRRRTRTRVIEESGSESEDAATTSSQGPTQQTQSQPSLQDLTQQSLYQLPGYNTSIPPELQPLRISTTQRGQGNLPLVPTQQSKQVPTTSSTLRRTLEAGRQRPARPSNEGQQNIGVSSRPSPIQLTLLPLPATTPTTISTPQLPPIGPPSKARLFGRNLNQPPTSSSPKSSSSTTSSSSQQGPRSSHERESPKGSDTSTSRALSGMSFGSKSQGIF